MKKTYNTVHPHQALSQRTPLQCLTQPGITCNLLDCWL